jgi:hypothetical protein
LKNQPQEEFMTNLGYQQYKPSACNLNNFFNKMRASATLPVVLPTEDMMEAPILMMPTNRMAIVDTCLITLKFESIVTLSEEQPSICFNTPEEFVTGVWTLLDSVCT